MESQGLLHLVSDALSVGLSLWSFLLSQKL